MAADVLASAIDLFNLSCSRRVSSKASFDLNRLPTQLAISLPYMDRTVMATIRAVCHENIDDMSGRQNGTGAWPEAFSSSLAALARFISSVNTGRLLLMARKNIFSPIVAAGSSLAICWTLMCSPLYCRPACVAPVGTVSVFSAVSSSCRSCS